MVIARTNKGIFQELIKKLHAAGDSPLKWASVDDKAPAYMFRDACQHLYNAVIQHVMASAVWSTRQKRFCNASYAKPSKGWSNIGGSSCTIVAAVVAKWHLYPPQVKATLLDLLSASRSIAKEKAFRPYLKLRQGETIHLRGPLPHADKVLHDPACPSLLTVRWHNKLRFMGHFVFPVSTYF